MKKSSIYIHIPFCKHKCIYCDFYSVITETDKEKFIDSLQKEMDYYSKEKYSGEGIKSIFFGGGTPSILSGREIGGILDGVRERYNLQPDCEITIECNPGTLDREKLSSYRDSGINRLSIGIQSFDDNELKFLTRIHDSKTAIETVEFAYKEGFENINVDMIFCLPNQSRETWLRNLETAMKLPIKHISAYSLILESGTILNKMVEDGKVSMRESEFDADIYEESIELLAKRGFAQYEVSNFAKEGFECKHNLAYWHHDSYLGFGPSAHSFWEGERWWNYTSLRKYIEKINKDGNGVKGRESLAEDDLLDEYVMLALRSDGIDLSELERRYGKIWYEKNRNFVETIISNGFAKDEKGKIKLTAKGYSICDEILTKFT